MQNTGAHTPIHPYMHTHRSTSHKYILNSLLLEANKFSFPLEFKDSTALRRKCILNSKYIFVVTVFHTARGKIWDRTGTTWGEMFGCYHGGRSLLESSRQKSAGLLALLRQRKGWPSQPRIRCLSVSRAGSLGFGCPPRRTFRRTSGQKNTEQHGLWISTLHKRE